MRGFFVALSKLVSRILFLNNHLSCSCITAGIEQPTKFGLALE